MYWFRGQSWHKHSLRYGCWVFFSLVLSEKEREWMCDEFHVSGHVLFSLREIKNYTSSKNYSELMECWYVCNAIRYTHTYTHTRVQMHVYWAKMVPCSIGSRTARFGFIISIHFDNFYGIRECLDIVSLYHILMWVCVYVCVRVCIVYTLAMFFAVSNPLSSSCFMAINVLWLFVIEIRFNDSD